MGNRKQPEIRFSGYTDDWEERKLGKVNAPSVEYIDPKKENLELWSVTVKEGLTPKTERYNREALVKKNDKFKAVHPEEIVYNPMNMTIGAVGFNTSGRSVAVSGYYVTMKLNQNYDSSFFNTWLTSSNAIKKYKLYATGSLIEKQRIQFPTLSSINSYIPSYNEQQKIGSFFKQLDDTIALHQRKLELLKKQKKGFLQKMFPKAGANTPEVRFAGFTDDWEQRKFSDLVFRLSKTSNSDQLPKVEFEDIIAGEGRLNKDISNKFDDRKGILFEPQDILYGKLRPYLKNWLVSDFNGVALGDFWVFRSTNTDSKFIYSLIQADRYQRVANDTAGTKMPRSDWKKVSSTSFSLPINIEEQQKIGQFFKQLDDTITLYQQELELLKETKKGFLQKMFV